MEDIAHSGGNWAEDHQPFALLSKDSQGSNPTEIFPLSFNQRSIWLQHVLEPHNVANNVSQAIRLHNKIDLGALRQRLRNS